MDEAQVAFNSAKREHVAMQGAKEDGMKLELDGIAIVNQANKKRSNAYAAEEFESWAHGRLIVERIPVSLKT